VTPAIPKASFSPFAAACLFALLVCLAPWTSLHAQAGLKIQLVAEETAIVPGRPFRLGLFIQHEPGWHTYWRHPGIVGVPTTMQWQLPPGFIAGPLEYPEPEATLMFQIKAQGYERDLLLQTEITPPADLRPGSRVTLGGRAAWMCCGKTCHPGTRALEISLSVAEKSQKDARWAPIFAKERQAMARASDAWAAEAEESGMQVRLILRPTQSNARRFSPHEEARVIFFTEDGWINSDQEQKLTVKPDGSLILDLVRAEVFLGGSRPERLHGVVQREGGWHLDGSLRSMTIQPLLRR
jgi:thiol:disulfide interchange protein DsbD